MDVQRQVIGDQADVVTQQGGEPALFHAENARIFAFPEPAVMHQYGIGGVRHCCIEQCLAGRDTGHHSFDFGTPFHLQAIGAIVAEAVSRQQAIGVGDQFTQLHG